MEIRVVDLSFALDFGWMGRAVCLRYVALRALCFGVPVGHFEYRRIEGEIRVLRICTDLPL